MEEYVPVFLETDEVKSKEEPRAYANFGIRSQSIFDWEQ